jgi:polyisoprenoid-binding protein YceI
MNKNNLVKILVFGMVTATIFAFSQATDRSVKNSSINFTIKNAGFDVDGTFKNLKVNTFNFDTDSLSKSEIDVTADATTVNTGNNKRDVHLNQDEYFNTAVYPTIRMKSKRFAIAKAGNVIGYFDLTIKGVTKEVKFPIYVTTSSEGTIFSNKGQLTISRLDYGVGESSFVLSDDAKISIEVKTN